MKILQIVGARPQFIKCFPVCRAIEEFNSSSGNMLQNILVHTGQHYDYEMSQIFFKEFKIKEPDYHLGVGSGLHGAQTGMIIHKVEEVLMNENPNAVIVYGDTNSTVGGALASVKMHIPVVHIEAGLRSNNKRMPEEINRVLTDHSSSLLLCPTFAAVENLFKEGFKLTANEGRLVKGDFDFSGHSSGLNNPLIVNSGDVMYDVLVAAVDMAERRSRILEDLQVNPQTYSVLTIHRAENTDNIESIEKVIEFINDASEGGTVIFPVHPRTQRVLERYEKRFARNVRMINPLGYFDMVWLVKNSSMVFTDSGGLQKEACCLSVPCVTLREETEWVETVESGWNVLYGNYTGSHNTTDKNPLFYGDGNSAKRIINAVVKTIW